MIEIRIHGRGGQGGVTLAKIIATSRFLEGQSVQAFGLYAAERSGAPVQAFCRYADEPITNRNAIYEPDHVIVLDPTLVRPSVAQGLKDEGWILVNTGEPPQALEATFPGRRLATVDATGIARENGLGTRNLPIVNTSLAGAVAHLFGFGLASVNAALEELGFAGPNLAAAAAAYETLRTYEGRPEELERRPAALPRPTPRARTFLDGGGGAAPDLRTGEWATQQPRRQQMVPPCNHVCPAGNDVRGFLQALARDAVEEAAEILFRTSPFPAVCGRVCPAPCMERCNRIGLDGAVRVRELERFVGDHATWAPPARNGREECVAVVGSGPAGLTAAYHLARSGYRVTVFEAEDALGGVLRTGIPGYRLPAEVLDREIARILALGVEARTGLRIGRAELLELAEAFDALLVATGLQELRSLRLGVGDDDAVEQGIEFLARAKRRPQRLEGEHVIVIGGGNTAVDAARTARRLGAESVRIVYRRSRFEMPAIPEEVHDALEEGVELLQLLSPVSLSAGDVDDAGQTLRELTCRSMELGEPDASGRRRPVEIPGSDFALPCHRVILALGQSGDLSIFPEGTEIREGGELLGLLERPLFAIGDLATGDGTVAAAIGSGRRAALHVHGTLRGEPPLEDFHPEAPPLVDLWSDEVVPPEAMKLHLFERVAPDRPGSLSPWARSWNFEEVHQGLPDAREARRCLSCGVCDACDRCITYCPEGVLKRVGDVFEFDYSFCKGCGVCAAECPRNVVFMSHL